jgi:hypothetical protein
MDSGPNWSNAKHRVGKPGHHLVDPVQLGVVVRVGRGLPGPGALEADAVLVQDDPDPFTADPDRVRRDPGRILVAVVGVEIGGQLADAPVRERQAEPGRPGLGRDHDDVDVGVGDPSRPSGAPVGCQHRQPLGVERVHDVAHGVLVRGDQPCDRRHTGPG